MSSPENVTYLSEYWGLSHWARRGTQVYAVAWSGPERSVDAIVPAALGDLVTAEVAAHTRAHAYGSFHLDLDPAADPDTRRIFGLASGHADVEQPLDALVPLLRDRLAGGGRLAIEQRGFAQELVDLLRSALPRVEFLPADELLLVLRAIKSDREIELLTRAAAITEAAVDASLAGLGGNPTELELAERFAQAIAREDARPETTVIGVGPRSALPNALPTSRRVAEGDIVRFDVGCRYGHYVSDIARSSAAGRATGEQRSLYSAIVEGLERGAEALRPGVTGGEVYAAAMGAVRRGGLADYRRTHCGHGIGIANYDLPRITAESADLLEPGMVICLETPYYRLGGFGLQVEDTFVLTRDGAERVTRVPQELPLIGR